VNQEKCNRTPNEHTKFPRGPKRTIIIGRHTAPTAIDGDGDDDGDDGDGVWTTRWRDR